MDLEKQKLKTAVPFPHTSFNANAPVYPKHPKAFLEAAVFRQAKSQLLATSPHILLRRVRRRINRDLFSHLNLFGQIMALNNRIGEI